MKQIIWLDNAQKLTIATNKQYSTEISAVMILKESRGRFLFMIFR